jgi:hypothetical protein
MADQDGLWTLPAPSGELRRRLTARIERARADGHDIPVDLELVTLALADHIDRATARGERRGFVMLTAEYRSCRDQLFAGADADGTDPLDTAMADFLANTNV